MIVNEAAANKIYIVQKYVQKFNVGKKKFGGKWKRVFFSQKIVFHQRFFIQERAKKYYQIYKAALIIITFSSTICFLFSIFFAADKMNMVIIKNSSKCGISGVFTRWEFLYTLFISSCTLLTKPQLF